MRKARADGRSICMVVHARYPMAEPRVERAAQAAHQHGWRVRVVALRDRGELPHEIVEGVEVVRLNVEHKRGRGLLGVFGEYLNFTVRVTLRLALGKAGWRFDVLQINTPPDFLALAGAIPRLRGTRIVLDIHDLSSHMYAVRFGHRPGANLLRRILRAVERTAALLADRVLTVHDPYASELARNGVPLEKIVVVMNSPSEAVINAAVGEARSERPSGFLIAYHGTITPWYGIGLLLDALARSAEQLGSWSALILGDGDALADAQRIALDRGIADRVAFSGEYLPIRETLVRVASADCGVIPNLPSELNQFALSSKLMEYVALGVPAVVARLETLASHFDEAEVTFFEPGNAASLSDAIQRVAADPRAAHEKAARAKARFASYAWSHNRARYLAVLDGLS